MVILGLDPGLATVGFGIIRCGRNECTAIDYGTITSPPDVPFPDRLELLYEDMLFLIDRFHPEEVAMEELFFSKNVTTGIQVAHARGVEILACKTRKLPLFEYTPMQVKQAITGYGRAQKIDVQRMVKTLLKLEVLPRPDDAADALAIALCHSFTGRLKESFVLR